MAAGGGPGAVAPAGLCRQIVVNTCRSGWRKWGSRVAIGDVPELANAPETDAVDDRELLRQALARLPARQREVLLLRYYEDLSEAEIAKRLGCAPGTVKSSAARALRALRDMLPSTRYRRGTVPDVTGGQRSRSAVRRTAGGPARARGAQVGS